MLQTLVRDPKEEWVMIKGVAFRNVYPVVQPPLSPTHPPLLPLSQQKLDFSVTTVQGGELHEAVTEFCSRP